MSTVKMILPPKRWGALTYRKQSKASHALSLDCRSLAVLVGAMLIQLSFTEQSLEIGDGVLLGIRIA